MLIGRSKKLKVLVISLLVALVTGINVSSFNNINYISTADLNQNFVCRSCLQTADSFLQNKLVVIFSKGAKAPLVVQTHGDIGKTFSGLPYSENDGSHLISPSQNNIPWTIILPDTSIEFFSKPKRQSIEIVSLVLKLLSSSNLTAYEIAFKANLNYARAKRILEQLKEAGLLGLIEEQGKQLYYLKPKGHYFLHYYEIIRSLYHSSA